MVNVTKAKAAIEAAKKEVKATYREAIAAGENDPLALNGLKPLGKANVALDKAIERLDEAVEQSTKKEPKKKAEAKK